MNFDDSFVGIFAQEAQKRGIEVLNFAMGGHYFLDQESLLKDFLKTAPKMPLKIFFTVNALHIPKFDRKNQNILVKSGYLFNANNWKLPYFRIMVGNISSAYCFFRDGLRLIQSKYFNFAPSETIPEHAY